VLAGLVRLDASEMAREVANRGVLEQRDHRHFGLASQRHGRSDAICKELPLTSKSYR
jgi:hypothetical protein